MANAFVIHRANTVWAGSPNTQELLGFDIDVDGEVVTVIAPHGEYPTVGREVSDAIREQFPDAQSVIVKDSGKLYRRSSTSTIVADSFRNAVEQRETVIGGKRYRLVPVD